MIEVLTTKFINARNLKNQDTVALKTQNKIKRHAPEYLTRNKLKI